MKYLQSYDKNRKRIGILSQAYDIQRTRRINSDYTLTFTVPMNSEDFREKLPLKGHVMDERGQFYVINSRQRSRDGRKLTAQISCTHVMFKLTDYKFPYASYMAEGYGIQITQLTTLIQSATGGRFSISVDDTFDLVDVKDFGRGNCLQALNDVVTLYGAEVESDNFTIHLRKKIGSQASDMQYRLGKNIVSSTFSDDGGSLCTRLFAQMKDGRTWIGEPASILSEEEQARLSAIPGAIVNGKLAVNYLVSQYADAWASDSVPYFDDELIAQDIEDPAKLVNAARKALAEREIPTVEVSVNAADLFKIDGTEPKPGLGDTVTCVDPELGLTNITARITELTEYPFETDKHSQVTVANVMKRDYAQIIADLDKAKRTFTDLLSGGRIRAEAFEEYARLAVIDVDNSKTEVKYDIRGILLQDKTDARNQVLLTSNGIVVSTDGGTTARTAITARGVVAETIVGQLGSFVSLLIGSGNNVTQVNTNGIAAGHATFSQAPFQVAMNGDVIARSIKLTGQIDNSAMYSSDITGGTITGALLRTAAAGARVELDAKGWRTYDANGRERISINANDAYGMNAISFARSDGSGAGTINGSDYGLQVYSYGSMLIAALSGGSVQFQGTVDFSNASPVGITTDKVEGLAGLLLAKVSKGDYTSSVTGGAHNHGIPTGAQFKAVDGTVYTWSAYSGFTHQHQL